MSLTFNEFKREIKRAQDKLEGGRERGTNNLTYRQDQIKYLSQFFSFEKTILEILGISDRTTKTFSPGNFQSSKIENYILMIIPVCRFICEIT